MVRGEGGGSLEKSGLSTSELWVKFKVFVPSNLTFGASGFFSALMLQDASSNDTLWLNVEDWGTPRLTLAGDALSYTDTGLSLTPGAVNTIQMRVKIGSNNGDVDIWLNTDTEGSPSYNGSGSMNTGTDSIDKVLAGLVYAPESGYSTTYYDDVTVDSAFIGTGGGGTPSSSTYQDMSYTYDAVGNITKIIDNSQTLASGTTTYAYDPLYRLTGATTTQAAGGANWSQTYAYNALGNITSKSDVGSYTYAGTGYANPHAVTAAGSKSYTYDNAGNVTSDGSTTYTWDYQNRLTQTSQGGGSGGGTTTSSYIYDDATTWADWSWGSTRNFNNTSPVYAGTKSIRVQYTTAWGGLYLQKDTAVPVSAYDTLKLAVHGGTTGGQNLELELYNDSDDVIDNVSLNSYIPGGTIAANTWYVVSIPLTDVNPSKVPVGGITVMSPTATTIYLDEIRFEGQGGGGGSATTTRYLYDHTGSRTAYFDGTATTTYPNKYFEQKGSTPTKHIFHGDTLIATVEGTGGSADVKTVHTDHLGGTNVVTNSGGEIEQTLSYYPFGQTRIDQKAGSFSETNKFTGHELDDATGLYYMQARYQSPVVGRFVSQDPVFWTLPGVLLANPQKQNSYTYADNNPISMVDPAGQVALPGAAIGALVGSAFGALDAYATGGNVGWGIAKGATGGAAAGFSGAYIPLVAGMLGVGAVSVTEDLYTGTEVDYADVGGDVAANLGGGIVATPYHVLKTTSRGGKLLLDANGLLVNEMVGLGVSVSLNYRGAVVLTSPNAITGPTGGGGSWGSSSNKSSSSSSKSSSTRSSSSSSSSNPYSNLSSAQKVQIARAAVAAYYAGGGK